VPGQSDQVTTCGCSVKLLNQIQSDLLRLQTGWDSDLRPGKEDALVQLDELEGDAAMLGSEAGLVLANIRQLRTRIIWGR